MTVDLERFVADRGLDLTRLDAQRTYVLTPAAPWTLPCLDATDPRGLTAWDHRDAPQRRSRRFTAATA
jgi:hypothetical protein